MAKLTEIPPFTGTGELYQMLDLIRNLPEYSKRFEKLESLRKAVNDSINLLGVGRNIEAANAQAESHRRVATEVLAEARKRSVAVDNETKARRQELKDQVATLEKTLGDRRSELNRITKEADSLLENAQAKADTLLRKATTDSQTAQKMLTSAGKLQDTWKEKKNKLNELLGKVRGI